MIIELEMLQAKLALLPDFPAELKILLEHLLISHHGEYEFGSPKLPMFPEAVVLHYLDDLDSKMAAARAILGVEGGEKEWTGYSPALNRRLLRLDLFSPREAAPDTPVISPCAPAQPAEP